MQHRYSSWTLQWQLPCVHQEGVPQWPSLMLDSTVLLLLLLLAVVAGAACQALT
jgi:hypothetical protein